MGVLLMLALAAYSRRSEEAAVARSHGNAVQPGEPKATAGLRQCRPLYLAVEELLVEAHEHQETTLLTTMFFLGFLLV